MNKYTLFLMSEKGLRTLEAILEEFEPTIVDFVVIGTDKNVTKDYSEDIQSLCSQNGIQTYGRSEVYEVNSEIILAVSWRWLIPLPETGRLITMHDSLLPKYRGFSPLVNQLINREPYIGVTAIFSNDEYDKGDIIEQVKVEVQYPIKIQEAIAMVSKLYGSLAKEVVRKTLKEDALETRKQDENKATYSLWRDEEDYWIDWNKNSEDILTLVDAVGFPFKGAKTRMMEKVIRIDEVQIVPDVNIENRDVGKVIFVQDGFPVVVCGKGLLKLTKAKFDSNNNSVFPLTKFRIRFS